MEFSWAISTPKRWCCESAALNMPANVENSAVATGLEKVSFHPNPKEKQFWRMFKVLHKCKSNAQNSPNEASTVREPWTSRCSSWIWKRQRNQRLNGQHLLDHWKSKTVPEKHLFLLYWLCQSVWINWKILKKMGIPDHLTCLLRNPYAGQDATVRNGHGGGGAKMAEE